MTVIPALTHSSWVCRYYRPSSSYGRSGASHFAPNVGRSYECIGAGLPVNIRLDAPALTGEATRIESHSLNRSPRFRTGIGFDAHNLRRGRALRLGGLA